MAQSKKRSNKKVQLILLGILFLVPPVAAYVLFYIDFKPSSGVNYGKLITPAKPLTDVALTTSDGQGFRLSDLRQKWLLLYIGGSQCDTVCSDNLYKINQVRLAQGKNIDRVSSVYIVPETALQATTSTVSERYPSILVLRAQPGVFADLVDQLRSHTDTTLKGPERVYIVDPLGNLMMTYHADADPTGIRKDLKRLLKLSQIG